MGQTDHFNTKEWRKTPIETADGTKYFINRLTGESRKEEYFEENEILGIKLYGMEGDKPNEHRMGLE